MRYTEVIFSELTIKHIYKSGKYKNVVLSRKGNGYTISFSFTVTDSEHVFNGKIFVEKEFIDKFKAANFKAGNSYRNVKAVEKERDDQKIIYTLDLGFCKPYEGMTKDDILDLMI